MDILYKYYIQLKINNQYTFAEFVARRNVMIGQNFLRVVQYCFNMLTSAKFQSIIPLTKPKNISNTNIKPTPLKTVPKSSTASKFQ